MNFLILRQLTHSELGMFHAYRDGREGSKQRAINFDGEVVDRVFPSARDSDKIFINCRCPDDRDTIVTRAQWLKRQGKNWRLEGNCPKNAYFSFVEPGVLFAMAVDASRLPATASWVVIPKEHPARVSILSHGESARLNNAGMIALYGSEGANSMQVLRNHFPGLFPSPAEIMTSSFDPNNLEPDPVGLFDILARAGHRLPSAVADLVDNSISEGASLIEISFPNPNIDGRWMCIRDNGNGMTPSQLQGAMRIGNQRIYGDSDLGKFGYGLKGASWSQADCMTVVTKAESGELASMTWDKEHLTRTRKWQVLTDPVEAKFAAAVDIPETGTAVLLTKMRPPAEMPAARGIDPYTLEVTSIREHLELVFHRYLEGAVKGRERVVILLNGVALVGNNPMGHPLTRHFDPRSIIIAEGELARKAVLNVQAFVMPNEEEVERYHKHEGPEAARSARDRISLYGRWNETQGLYFYRLDRLIKWGGWADMFAMDEKTKLLRVAVDFDRTSDDALQVNISKQEIRLPVTVSNSIATIIKEPRAEARSRYKKRVPPQAQPVGTAAPSSSGEVILGHERTNLNPGTSGAKPKGPKPIAGPIRLVDAGPLPWICKTGFAGRLVEITPQIPALVKLVRSIESDLEAKTALSEFLSVLELAGVPKLLLSDV